MIYCGMGARSKTFAAHREHDWRSGADGDAVSDAPPARVTACIAYGLGGDPSATLHASWLAKLTPGCFSAIKQTCRYMQHV